MPFLQVLWNPDRFEKDEIVRVRDALIDAVGPALTEADPAHTVTDRMVDAKLIAIGPLDSIRTDLFVTLLARHEPARAAAAAQVIDRLWVVAARVSGFDHPVIELCLTSHASSFDYSALE